jgi:hypothetical protein
VLVVVLLVADPDAVEEGLDAVELGVEQGDDADACSEDATHGVDSDTGHGGCGGALADLGCELLQVLETGRL